MPQHVMKLVAPEACGSMCALHHVPSISALSTEDSSVTSGRETPPLSMISVEVSESELSDSAQGEFCPDEPLRFEDADIVIHNESIDDAGAKALPWKRPTPDLLA